VVDPFAGGGAIPLEALRIGADAFASDLNPVAVLLNKVVLEYIPKYGQTLADEVRKWGQWVKEEAEKELGQFYPKDEDGSTPIAYLWARTIISEAPDDGSGIPVEVPLMRSLWLGKKPKRSRALRWVRDEKGTIQTEIVTVTYADGITRRVKRPLLEIFEPKSVKDVEDGTVNRGSATCPVTKFTTPVTSVRKQLKTRKGGANDARLFCVVLTKDKVKGRFYRLPNQNDLDMVDMAAEALEKRIKEHSGELSLIPDEPVPPNGRSFRLELYGIIQYSDIFTLRQSLALTTLVNLVKKVRNRIKEEQIITYNNLVKNQTNFNNAQKPSNNQSEINQYNQCNESLHNSQKNLRSQVNQLASISQVDPISSNQLASINQTEGLQNNSENFTNADNKIEHNSLADIKKNEELAIEIDQLDLIKLDEGLADAVQTCLGIAIDKQADKISSLGRWDVARENPQGVFARQAIPIMWDYTEVNPFSGSAGDLETAIGWILDICKINSILQSVANSQQANAQNHPLPDDFVQAFISDPPYYDAIEYSDLSDFFYVWLKRTLPPSVSLHFKEQLTPKQEECIVDEIKGKDKAYFETTMGQAMAEGCRILASNGIGVIVFAHKSTSGWEAMLQAMIEAGWTITASWAIDTEMGTRLRAMNSAALASSIHLVCRPRNNNDIGDWREVLQALLQRIHEWMPRLASEGIVGADAIFACLGPALEIYSRYSSVEKASGEPVTLREYLEYVWAAVSKEALGMIFQDADATGFEADARLTAIWLWTLSTGNETTPNNKETDETDSKTSKTSGFTLEFDAARKIAQGLGVHLETLPTLVKIKGDKATLLSVAERSPNLLGKAKISLPKSKKTKKDQTPLITGIEDYIPEETPPTEDLDLTGLGNTVLDRIHQTMLLFAAGRSEAIKRFLVDDGVGDDQRFWKLADCLSKLYPNNSEEKRWVDGILARKKGLGF
jgi:adenine-specific DNA methylase